MENLSDHIEKYLKQLIENSPNYTISIRRRELAGQFQCVPSQINYVLSTRFTPEKGYLVSSRRGGGGYIEIRKLKLAQEGPAYQLVKQAVGDSISEQEAKNLILRCCEEQLISNREKDLLFSCVNRESLPLPLPTRDKVRATLLKNVFLEILKQT